MREGNIDLLSPGSRPPGNEQANLARNGTGSWQSSPHSLPPPSSQDKATTNPATPARAEPNFKIQIKPEAFFEITSFEVVKL